MRVPVQSAGEGATARLWRHAVTVLVLCGPLAILLSMQPFVEPPGYLDFADRRAFLGVPNFLDVVSNLPFLLVGIAGLRVSLRVRPEGSLAAWVVFFVGVTIVSFGSAYFHWSPSADSIVWDRLPMVLGFTGLFVALLADYVSARLDPLLIPAAVVGLASVIYGYWYEDLRLYAWIQALPLLAIVAVFLYPPRYTGRGYLLVAVTCYALAKIAELYDRQVFALTAGIVSGHTLKHLIAALGIWAILTMLKRRALTGDGNNPR